jgi:hypothetical protein
VGAAQWRFPIIGCVHLPDRVHGVQADVHARRVGDLVKAIDRYFESDYGVVLGEVCEFEDVCV